MNQKLQIKLLLNDEVEPLRGFVSGKKDKSFKYKNHWHEGVNLLGYWPQGDSFILESNGEHICISRHFVKELLGEDQL